MHQKSDVAERGAPNGDETRKQPGGETYEKSYRYLRLAMVGLLICVAVAVGYQSVLQGRLLGSVSAYYYTPAQAFFVSGLIGLGACMIALRGMNTLEDAALNLGGVFAAIVAIVPTGRNADFRAAVLACEKAETPLLTDLDCPTVQALVEANRANVDNNLFALLAVGAIALLASLVFAWKDRTLANRKARKSFLWGFGVASGLWLVILFARVASLQWVIKNFHWIAAVLLFICIFVVAIANARRVKDESHDRAKDQSSAQPSSEKPSSEEPSSVKPVKQSMEAAGDLIGVGKRGDRYIWFARVMLLGAVVTLVLWRLTDLTLFWVEVSVFLLFIAFWTAQTIELDPRQKTVLEPPKTADQS